MEFTERSKKARFLKLLFIGTLNKQRKIRQLYENAEKNSNGSPTARCPLRDDKTRGHLSLMPCDSIASVQGTLFEKP